MIVILSTVETHQSKRVTMGPAQAVPACHETLPATTCFLRIKHVVALIGCGTVSTRRTKARNQQRGGVKMDFEMTTPREGWYNAWKYFEIETRHPYLKNSCQIDRTRLISGKTQVWSTRIPRKEIRKMPKRKRNGMVKGRVKPTTMIKLQHRLAYVALRGLKKSSLVPIIYFISICFLSMCMFRQR